VRRAIARTGASTGAKTGLTAGHSLRLGTPTYPAAAPFGRAALHTLATVLGLTALVAGGCATAPTGRARDLRACLLAFDDNRPTGTLTFPTPTYEALVRFEAPPGQHRPWRLWMMAAAAGSVTVSLYKNTVFEAPGEPFETFTRELSGKDLSTGKDGRWAVEDLQDLDAIEGVIWVGVRKACGTPALWTASNVSGQSFLRDRDPTRGVGILPVKRTPMLRVELAPPDLPRTPIPAAPASSASATPAPPP